MITAEFQATDADDLKAKVWPVLLSTIGSYLDEQLRRHEPGTDPLESALWRELTLAAFWKAAGIWDRECERLGVHPTEATSDLPGCDLVRQKLASLPKATLGLDEARSLLSRHYAETAAA